MGIEIPDSLQWVAKYILGAGDWPEGDETAMRRLGDAWNSMADTLDQVDDDAAQALNAALTAIAAGETHTAVAAYRDTLLAGDDAAFTAIAKYCRYQAELLDDGANDIEHTKLVIIGTMIVAAVEIGAAIATSWTGVGAVAGVAARVAAQVAVRIAIKQLIARMITRGALEAAARAALRGAAFEALEEGGIDAIARSVQVGKGDRSMDEFGWGDLGLATFAGAVGGAVGGGLGSHLDGLSDTATSKLGRFATDTATGTGTELAADLSAQAAAAAITGQGMDIGLDTFTSAGAGGIQSAVESGDNGPAPAVPDLDSPDPAAEGTPTTPASTETPSPTEAGELDTPPSNTTDTASPISPAGNDPAPTNDGSGTPTTSDSPTTTLPATATPDTAGSPAPASPAAVNDNTPASGVPASTTTPAPTPPAAESAIPDSTDSSQPSIGETPVSPSTSPTDAHPAALNLPPESAPMADSQPAQQDPRPAPVTETSVPNVPAEAQPHSTQPSTTAPPVAADQPTSSPPHTGQAPHTAPTASVDTTTAATSTPTTSIQGTTPTSTPTANPSPTVPTATPLVTANAAPQSLSGPRAVPATDRTTASAGSNTTGTRDALIESRTSSSTSAPATPSTSTPSGNRATLGTSPHRQAQPVDPGTSPNPPGPLGPSATSSPQPVPPSPAHHHPARELRESLRGLPSQDGRNPAIDVNRNPWSQRPPAYRVRRFDLGGGHWVAVADIRVRVTDADLLSPDDLHQVQETVQATIDAVFNNGSHLLSGDQLLIDVQFTPDAEADLSLSADHPASAVANTLREHLGLFPTDAGAPLSAVELREISNDIARANTATSLTNPADTRIFDHQRLTDVESLTFQNDVEDSLRNGNSFDRFADPRTHAYGQLINDGGPDVPGRSNNCLDCSLSALSSFFGVPQVSAPRWPDTVHPDPENPDYSEIDNRSGERDGMARASTWLGSPWLSYSGLPVHSQFEALHNYVAGLGPGSAAIVTTWFPRLDADGTIVHDSNGLPEIVSGHATVVVYPPGADGPVWWDPQHGLTTDAPPGYLVDDAVAMECIPIDPNGGIPNAGTGINSGTGQAIDVSGLRPEPGVLDPGEPAGLGLPGDPDSGTGEAGRRGVGQSGDQQAHGSDHGPQQPAGQDDRGDVRRGDRSGQPATGRPGPSEATPHSPDPTVGDREHDRVPDRSDVSRRPPAAPADPTGDDHQESDPPRPDRPSRSGSDLVGIQPSPAHGDVAPGRDVRGVTGPATDPGPVATATTDPSTMPSSGAAQHAPTASPQQPTTTTPGNNAAPQPTSFHGAIQPSQTPASVPDAMRQEPITRHPGRVLREALRNLPSQDGRTPAIDVNRNPWSQRPPAYRIRRFHLGGEQWVAVATIRAHLFNADLLDPAALDRAVENVQATVDSSFNNGSRLLSGDQFLVDVEFVADPAGADLLLDPNQSTSSTGTALREHVGLPFTDPNRPLTADDLREISNDLARANTPSRVSNPGDSRIYDHRRLEDVEHPSYQHYVEDALRNGNSFDRFADPRTHPYGQLINDGGQQVPGRSNNCVDCSLSALASFHGIPQISAPRWPDLRRRTDAEVAAEPDLPRFVRDTVSGERGGDARAEAWLGRPWVAYSGMPVPRQYQALHDYIAALGPGASALVGTDWPAYDTDGNRLYRPDGTPIRNGGHATVIVYPVGAAGPVWWDPQTGHTSDSPPPTLAHGAAALQFIPISPEGGPDNAGTGVDPGTSQTPAGQGLRLDGAIPDRGDPARLGLPASTDPGATRRDGERTRHLHDQQAVGSDNRTRELPPRSDSSGIRFGDRSGQPPAGIPGVPETTPDSADPDLRGRDSDRVPNTPDLPRRSSASGDDAPGSHHQESATASAHRPPVGGSSDMGAGPGPGNRSVAGGADVRGVNSGAPTAQHPHDGAHDPEEMAPSVDDMRRGYVPPDAPNSMEPAEPEIAGDIRLDTGDHVYFDTDRTTIGYDAATESNRQRIARLEGYHDVVVHGTSTGYFVPGRRNAAGVSIDMGEVHPFHIAEAIRNHPGYSGQPIRLISCFTGTFEDGADGVSAAQRLSNILGVPVMAPTDAVGVRSDRGEQQPRVRGNGSWRTFLPLLE